ncbi:MAG: class I SAM-dependent methyltransferase [Firmicutes bacterium]|nr:class I SAM-dependent methyltransferase [Bacillota bacterium]
MHKTVNLSPRLQLIADKVREGSAVADIGTDHAYVPIYLIQKGIATFAVASDVRKGPVEKAAVNVKKYGLQDRIDVRLGDGLEKIKQGEADTLIVAGMGGVLMCEILSAAVPIVETMDRLILQPMIGQEEVRRWLEGHDFKIIDEALSTEGHKIYNVIVAEKGKEEIDKEVYYEIGKKLIQNQDPLLKRLLLFKINEMHKIIGQLENKDSENASVRLGECRQRLREFEKLMN